MVVTDLPFRIKPLFEKRYNFLNTYRYAIQPERNCKQTTSGLESSADYANFLVEEHKEWSKLKAPNKKASRVLIPSVSIPQSNQLHSVNLVNMVDKSNDEFCKNMRLIEDNMWKEKQAELTLSRLDGDIIKKRNTLKQVINRCKQTADKVIVSKDKKLNETLKKYTDLQHREIQRKEKLCSSRKQEDQTVANSNKDTERRFYLLQNSSGRAFSKKWAELEKNRAKINLLTGDFEKKLKLHEDTEDKLKIELAELALQINAHYLKHRTYTTVEEQQEKTRAFSRISADLERRAVFQNQLNKSQRDVKVSDMQKQQLETDYVATKSAVEIKLRDEARHLTDTRGRLADNQQTQRLLSNAMFHAELDKRAHDIELDIKAHRARKLMLDTDKRMKCIEQHKLPENDNNESFRKLYDHQQATIYDDNLKHFQKQLQTSKDIESCLHQELRVADSKHYDQKQIVQILNAELAQLKQNNSRVLKEVSKSIKDQEYNLKNKILRETSRLNKFLNVKSERYNKLQLQHVFTVEDKRSYSAYKNQRNHAQRISYG